MDDLEALGTGLEGRPVAVTAIATRSHLTALDRRFGVRSRAGLLAELLPTSSPPNPQG